MNDRRIFLGLAITIAAIAILHLAGCWIIDVTPADDDEHAGLITIVAFA